MLYNGTIKSVILHSSSASLESNTHSGFFCTCAPMPCSPTLCKGHKNKRQQVIFSKKIQWLFGDSTTQAPTPAQHQGDLWHMCFVSPSSSPTRHVGQSLYCVPWHWGNKDGLILVLRGLHKPALLSFHIHIFFRERGRWKNSIHENAASKLSVISRMEVSKHPPHFENTT